LTVDLKEMAWREDPAGYENGAPKIILSACSG
jgi:hypothetical protein